MMTSLVVVRTSLCDGARGVVVMNRIAWLAENKTTSHEEREQWGTPIVLVTEKWATRRSEREGMEVTLHADL